MTTRAVLYVAERSCARRGGFGRDVVVRYSPHGEYGIAHRGGRLRESWDLVEPASGLHEFVQSVGQVAQIGQLGVARLIG